MADITLPAIDSTRHEIARDATYEVQVLAQALREAMAGATTDGELATLARGMLMRIEALSDIIFEAVIQDDDQREDARTLASRLGVPAQSAGGSHA